MPLLQSGRRWFPLNASPAITSLRYCWNWATSCSVSKILATREPFWAVDCIGELCDGDYSIGATRQFLDRDSGHKPTWARSYRSIAVQITSHLFTYGYANVRGRPNVAKPALAAYGSCCFLPPYPTSNASATLPFAIPRACDFFDFFVFSA